MLTRLHLPSDRVSLQFRGRRCKVSQAVRFFSTANLRGINSKKSGDDELTNSKLWEKVLSNHPEHVEEKGGDLLYEYPRKSYFGYMSAGSLAHIAFWSWLKGYEQSLVEMHPVLGEPTFYSFISDDFGSSVGFGMSILLAGLIGFQARVNRSFSLESAISYQVKSIPCAIQRTVARISIVAGGDKLRFTTHKFFGDLGPPIDVPISCVSAHPNTKNNIILKLASTRGFFLVDTKGQFYNREKLEQMITFRTNSKEHKAGRDKKSIVNVRTDLPRVDLKAEAAQMKVKRTLSRLNARHGNLLGKKHISRKHGKKK
ncbi:hypothetical protein CCR75_006660 [Bremia lactucae]|uniref:Uncharacterized protein n=1 Tax=Bremia lactucae TaxID=4779 RepID=A0A976IEF8_BRELC|nr:hypothetical protein CCR75_006660 [Bremia lactucae]